MTKESMDELKIRKIKKKLETQISIVLQNKLWYNILLACLSRVSSSSSCPGDSTKSFRTSVQGCGPGFSGAYCTLRIPSATVLLYSYGEKIDIKQYKHIKPTRWFICREIASEDIKDVINLTNINYLKIVKSIVWENFYLIF